MKREAFFEQGRLLRIALLLKILFLVFLIIVRVNESLAQESTNELRNVADKFIISNVGEDYFVNHYTFSRVESVAEGEGVVYYQVRFNNEIALYECRVVLKNYKVIAANAVLEKLEIAINRSEAIRIAQENEIRVDAIGFSLTEYKREGSYIYLKPYWQITMSPESYSCTAIVIDAVTGEYSVKIGPPAPRENIMVTIQTYWWVLSALALAATVGIIYSRLIRKRLRGDNQDVK